MKTPKLFNSQKDGLKIVTPRGIAAFAHLAKPDTEGTYADNKFKVTLKLKKGEKDVEEFVAKLRKHEEVSLEKQKNAWGKKKLEAFGVVKDGDDKDDAEEKGWAGFWLVTGKTKSKPSVFDAKKNKVPASIEVRSGDEIKIQIVAVPFDKIVQGKGGLSVYLNAVQLLAKNSGTSGSADGFDEEDGYEAETTTADGGEGENGDTDGDF